MTYLISILSLIYPSLSMAVCPVYDSRNAQVKELNDGVFYLLESAGKCPLNVIEWNELIEDSGLHHAPSMVANRGRNNPSLGSFSFFESVTGTMTKNNIEIKEGEFFYGHFTDKKHGKIILDQAPTTGKLLIELIAWDYKKEAYNFYELIGQDQKTSRWFYRGDSFDALKDNEFLYRDNGDNPKFGSRMRCSACHNSGGPIMKELSYPHNDWWTFKRSLVFGNAQLDTKVSNYIKALLPAEKFAKVVKVGIHKLESSQTYQQVKSNSSLQEQLRPLFCEQEINLESDVTSNEAGNFEIQIPSSFLINPILGSKEIKVPRAKYEGLLSKYNIKFPETGAKDSDHAWLTPVKGYSDLLAIKSLVNKKVVSTHFVKSVLMIDSANPLFSKKRCDLLKKVPLWSESNWEKIFLQNLPKEDTQINNENLVSVFGKLLKLRKEVYNSEISQNPSGQILEPGFRVIFPE